MCRSVPPYPYPLRGSFKMLCPSWPVSHHRAAAEALFNPCLCIHGGTWMRTQTNQGNSCWRWPGVRDKQLSWLQSSGSLMPAPLWCPCRNTASGEGEKGPRSVCPVISKYFPLHKHLQLFIEHWSPQHLNAISLWISEILMRFSTSWDVLDWQLWKEVLWFSTALRKGTWALSSQLTQLVPDWRGYSQKETNSSVRLHFTLFVTKRFKSQSSQTQFSLECSAIGVWKSLFPPDRTYYFQIPCEPWLWSLWRF